MTYNLSETNKANLKKLADYLESLPEDYRHFDMGDFLNGGLTATKRINYALKGGKMGACGTVACALGHGPAAGILFSPEDTSTHDISWSNYLEKFIGKDNSISSPIFEFLFGSDWVPIDNHHYGAAARIRYILSGKYIPEDDLNPYTYDKYHKAYRKDSNK